MKNIVFIFMLIFAFENVSAQSGYLNITGLQITQITDSQIKVNLKVFSPVVTYYKSYTTDLNENVVTLKVCYTVTIAQATSNHDNDFFVDIPPASGNYTFKVEVYAADFGVCIYDNSHLEDSASLNFTNPFSGTISLSTSDPDNTNKNVNVYPNPVKEILHFSEEVSNVKITDLSGRTVKQISASGKSVNVSTLAKGVYIITATAKSGKTIIKKIIKE